MNGNPTARVVPRGEHHDGNSQTSNYEYRPSFHLDHNDPAHGAAGARPRAPVGTVEPLVRQFLMSCVVSNHVAVTTAASLSVDLQ